MTKDKKEGLGDKVARKGAEDLGLVAKPKTTPLVRDHYGYDYDEPRYPSRQYDYDAGYGSGVYRETPALKRDAYGRKTTPGGVAPQPVRRPQYPSRASSYDVSPGIEASPEMTKAEYTTLVNVIARELGDSLEDHGLIWTSLGSGKAKEFLTELIQSQCLVRTDDGILKINIPGADKK